MSPSVPGDGARVFFGPADATLVGCEPDGTPITAGVDSGVGPMTEVTQHVVAIDWEVTP